MCGRFALSDQYFEKLIQELGILNPNQESFLPSFNISPGQMHPIVYKEGAKLFVQKALWGITPSWMKPGQLLFNAKIETALEKPTFKKAYTLERCIIPINGFYEWVKEGEIKQPYFFHRMNDEVFFLGGIYYRYGLEKKFVVMTTKANAMMEPFHHRMSILLTQKTCLSWLSTKALMEREAFMDVQALLSQHKVTTKVNSSKFDSSACVKPL